ncbi:helix-turn-helix domain-containing protein [Schaalia sp.]|uniref:helix-turn-helix domain-containing protein n=1 Tax=Schaalia sp. TaxID=2691890 RepID=UPI003D152109
MKTISKQAIISDEVRRYMQALGLTQVDIAKTLGVQAPAVSRKINGSRRWSIEDVDRLEADGCPIGLRILYMGEEVGA